MGRARQRKETFKWLGSSFSSPFEKAKYEKLSDTPTQCSGSPKKTGSRASSSRSKSPTPSASRPSDVKNSTENGRPQDLAPLSLAETAEVDGKDDACLTKSSTYHIYHSGGRTLNFNFHSIPDKDAVLPQADDPLAPNYVDSEKLRNYKPSLMKKVTTLGKASKTPPGPRIIKRSVMVSKPHLDLRTATAPYFVHHPQVGARHLPLTLRRGGSKDFPTACLISGFAFWRKYQIVLDDRFAQEGVIDGRGVVSAKYGTKKGKQGTLQGYKFKKRSGCDTGKQWSVKERARRKELKEAGTFVNDDWTEPITPEEIVWLRWRSPLSHKTRTYTFNWSGFEFCWKGTALVRDEKLWGVTVTYSHLKLIVKVPSSDSHDSYSEKDDSTAGKGSTNGKAKKPEKICLALYTCLAAGRKAGRLEVFHNVVDDFYNQHVLSDEERDGVAQNHGSISTEKDKKRQRLDDLIMATSICMIRSEAQKRELLLEMLIVAAENGGG